MKVGLKEMKKEYKKVNIDEIEVCFGLLLTFIINLVFSSLWSTYSVYLTIRPVARKTAKGQ